MTSKRALSNLRDKIVYCVGTYDECLEWLDIVEKDLKAFEVIRDREVSIQSFRKKNYVDYEDYCNRSSIYENSTLLTKEEFDLLKEVIK